MNTRRFVPVLFSALVLFVSLGASRLPLSRTEPEKSPSIQRASTRINPLGSLITISNDSPLVELSPDIAYNATQDNYLVVWYNDRPGNDDIRAQRLTKDGRLLGGPFYISAAGDGIDRRYPRIAYNVKSDQFLVVWEHQENLGYSIHGRRVSDTGMVLDSSDIVIRGAGANLYTPKRPVVAYAYTSDKYLVVWEETWHPLPINTSIVGQVVLGSGALDGGLITISQDPGYQYRTNPDLAYNLGRNEYLVAWEQLDPNSKLTDIYSRRVTGNGLPLSPETTQVAYYTVSSTAPAVAAMPIQPDGQYFVTWELHYSQDDWDISGVLISPDGVPQIYIDVAATGAHASQPSISTCLKRNQYLVTWKQVPVPSLIQSNVAGRLVTSSGSLDDDPMYLDGMVSDHPRLANGWLGDFMTVYDDIPLTVDSGIYGQLIGNRIYLPWSGKEQ